PAPMALRCSPAWSTGPSAREKTAPPGGNSPDASERGAAHFRCLPGSPFLTVSGLRRLRSRLARRAPHDKLRGIFDFVDKWNGKRGRGRAGGHHVHGRLAAGAQVMVDG